MCGIVYSVRIGIFKGTDRRDIQKPTQINIPCSVFTIHSSITKMVEQPIGEFSSIAMTERASAKFSLGAVVGITTL